MPDSPTLQDILPQTMSNYRQSVGSKYGEIPLPHLAAFSLVLRMFAQPRCASPVLSEHARRSLYR